VSNLYYALVDARELFQELPKLGLELLVMRLGTERFNIRLCRIDGWLSEGNVFNPQSQYDVYFDNIPIRDFLDYWEEFVVRPPYQRKTVWNRKKQQALLDSLFRRYYVPRIVIREVRLDDQRTVREVIDGQQRIVTANLFLTGQLPLPYSFGRCSAGPPGCQVRRASAGAAAFRGSRP
jgi:hypothetical protein